MGHVACMGEKRRAYGVLIGTPEGETGILQRHGHRWEDIKVDLQEEGC